MKNSIYLVAIAFIAFILIQIASKRQDSIVDIKIERKIDTIIKYDTIVEYTVKYKDRKVTDTVYIETENKPFLALPVVSKHFAKENLYDLWISGVEPLKMDSLKLYPQSKQETIVITNNTLLKPKTNSLFANVGIISFNGILSPRAGISIKTKKERLYGLEIGSYDGKMFYGVNIGIKINK